MESIRNRSGSVRNIVLAVILLLCVWIAAGYVTAEAASAPFQKLEAEINGNQEKVGSYYFKYDYDYADRIGTWKYSKKQNTGFKKIYKSDRVGDIVTNGKSVYYIDYGKLYSYNISKKRNKQLKKLPMSDDVVYRIGAAYGKNIYLTRGSFMEWRLDTYKYNTASKKYKKAKSNYEIKDQYGRNVVGQEEFRSDASAYPVRVCKLTSTGISKGKRIAKAGINGIYISKKLYFVKYSDWNMKEAVLYRAAADGSKKTELGRFVTEEEYGQIFIDNITSKDCIVIKDGKRYKYTYKTKQMTEIE